MRAIALLLLISKSVLAADFPADAPTVLVVTKGQFAPFNGVLLSDEKAVLEAKRVARCEAENEELKKGRTSTIAIIILASAALILGGAAGYGIARAVK